jgi:hypothetical protein
LREGGERAVVPEASVLFGRFLFEAQSEGGARVMFQSLVTDLVMLRHPGASEVAGPGGGDWGIDTYVGTLDDTIVVWQSKFFMTWNGEDQRKQVRGSFKQLMDKAQSENFVVDAWTLCVPCVLAPGEQQWFDRWAAKAKRDHGVVITLWNGVRLRRFLMQADAADVYKAYFTGDEIPLPVEPLRTLQDVSSLSDALFVRQLEEAGHAETDAARGLFFAAEALARDGCCGQCGWDRRFGGAAPRGAVAVGGAVQRSVARSGQCGQNAGSGGRGAPGSCQVR